MKLPGKFLFALLLVALGRAMSAQVTCTNTTTADAFLATGSANNPAGSDLADLNYGGAGTLVIAPPTSAKGEFQSVIRFNLADALSLFNATYGSNAWIIGDISLELTSNYGTEGVQPNNPIFPVVHTGKFIIEWLSDDDWVEGTGSPSLPTMDGVTYGSLTNPPSTNLLTFPHVVLCTNTYVPPGNNVHVTWKLPLKPELVADVTAGGDVSFLFYAADDQVTYLFNSYFYGRGNQPLIRVTAIGGSVPPLKITAGCFTNTFFHLTGAGSPNTPYAVQALTNLSATNWQTIGSATADAAGIIQFDDPAAANQPQRFYRLAQWHVNQWEPR